MTRYLINPPERYNIYCKDKLLYENLTEEEYMNTMEDLAQQFYEVGTPHPNDLYTQTFGEELNGES